MGNKVAKLKHKSTRLERRLSDAVHRKFSSSGHNQIRELKLRFPSTKAQEFDLQLLIPLTHFSPVELKILKIYFSAFCNSPNNLYATKEDCKQFFFRRMLYTPGFEFTLEHEFILTAVFNAINTDNDGFMSFTELALAMSAAVHGSFQEKASLSFRLYDADGNGTLTREEMRDYIRILNRLGILRLASKLQTSRTRGDATEQELHLMRNHSVRNQMPSTTYGQSSYNQVDSGGGAELNASLPHPNPPPTQQPPPPLPPYHSSSTNGATVNSPPMEESNAYYGQSMPAVAEDVFDPSVTYSDDESISHLSENDIDYLVNNFFGEYVTMNFDEYCIRSTAEKYLLEGLGLYDYIFLPMVQSAGQYLSRPDKYEQSGMMHVDGRPYWIIVRDGCIFHCDPEMRTINKALHINKIENVLFESWDSFTLKIDGTYVQYQSPSQEQTRPILLCIMLHFVSQIDNRFDSFCPVRSERNARFYPMVDGEETYRIMAQAMLSAREQIFLAGWCVNPFLYLIRDPNIPDLYQYRLDQILLKMAKNNVQIFIIIWHETAMAGMNLSTVKIRKLLTALNPNIHCIVHPRTLPFSWSHHQKILVVDQVVAFVGGLDIGTGRWDNFRHEIVDNNHIRTKWPGSDYCNETLARTHKNWPMKSKVDAFRDGLDRDLYPRLPWHDVHCVLVGKVATDVASNFINRWNHHNRMDRIEARTSNEGGYYNIVLNLKPYDPAVSADVSTRYLPNIPLSNVRAQALRSISIWSGSLRTERSIQTAIVESIKNAQHYVYIENQYFISHTPLSEKVENQVAMAIINRIAVAIESNQVFRIIIILPVHHSGDIYDPSTHQVIKWQRRTIDGIYDSLQRQYPQANIDQYISFFALASYGFICGMPQFSQIYVHAKLLLVDDRLAIIGSANINDRSLQGNHDSEIAVIVEDLETTTTVFNGKTVKTGKSIKKLRKRVCREHFLGDPSVHPSAVAQSLGEKFAMKVKENRWQLKDPLSDLTYHYVRKRASANSRIYESVFPHYPSKRHPTLTEYKQDFEKYAQSVQSQDFQVDARALQSLSLIKGQVVEYPREWLKNDPLKKDTKLKVVDDNIFY